MCWARGAHGGRGWGCGGGVLEGPPAPAVGASAAGASTACAMLSSWEIRESRSAWSASVYRRGAPAGRRLVGGSSRLGKRRARGELAARWLARRCMLAHTGHDA